MPHVPLSCHLAFTKRSNELIAAGKAVLDGLIRATIDDGNVSAVAYAELLAEASAVVLIQLGLEGCFIGKLGCRDCEPDFVRLVVLGRCRVAGAAVLHLERATLVDIPPAVASHVPVAIWIGRDGVCHRTKHVDLVGADKAGLGRGPCVEI